MSYTIDEDRLVQLFGFEDIIGYRFNNLSYLDQALIHASYYNERGLKNPNRGRFEILGDAVLNFIVSDIIIRTQPDINKGKITRMRSEIVRRRNLFSWGKEIGLDRYMLLGKGEKLPGASGRFSIIAEGFEAVLGAMYLDSGIEPVRTFLNDRVVKKINDILAGKVKKNYKVLLQEAIQKTKKSPPVYEIVESSGPPHRKYFKVAVRIDNAVVAYGYGKNRKTGEINAARKAFLLLNPEL